MPNNDTLIAPDGTQTAAASNSDANAGDSGAGSGAVSDATLLSRYAGQTAKVNELTGQLSAESKARIAAEQKLADYEAGKVSADEALKSQLALKEKEAADARQEAALARIEAKYPETFALFGQSAAQMAPEILAASEARLSGAAGDQEPPTPKAHNESKTSQPAAQKKEESADDVEARLLSMANPWAN